MRQFGSETFRNKPTAIAFRRQGADGGNANRTLGDWYGRGHVRDLLAGRDGIAGRWRAQFAAPRAYSGVTRLRFVLRHLRGLPD